MSVLRNDLLEPKFYTKEQTRKLKPENIFAIRLTLPKDMDFIEDLRLHERHRVKELVFEPSDSNKEGT